MFAALAKKDLFEGLLQKFRFTSRSVFICLVGEMLNEEGENDTSEAEGSSSSSMDVTVVGRSRETGTRATNGSTEETAVGVATTLSVEAAVMLT